MAWPDALDYCSSGASQPTIPRAHPCPKPKVVVTLGSVWCPWGDGTMLSCELSPRPARRGAFRIRARPHEPAPDAGRRLGDSPLGVYFLLMAFAVNVAHHPCRRERPPTNGLARLSWPHFAWVPDLISGPIAVPFTIVLVAWEIAPRRAPAQQWPGSAGRPVGSPVPGAGAGALPWLVQGGQPRHRGPDSSAVDPNPRPHDHRRDAPARASRQLVEPPQRDEGQQNGAGTSGHLTADANDRETWVARADPGRSMITIRNLDGHCPCSAAPTCGSRHSSPRMPALLLGPVCDRSRWCCASSRWSASRWPRGVLFTQASRWSAVAVVRSNWPSRAPAGMRRPSWPR